jgi:heme oxygenase
MRARTNELHRAAERSGIIAAILGGDITEVGYATYLRNLLPAYQAMESALQGRPGLLGIGEPAQQALFRADSIVADLHNLAGADWVVSLPLRPAATLYADRVAWAASKGPLLIAHVYTRYLGDLNGGQVLARRLLRRFGPGFRATSFMAFPDIADIGAFTSMLRAALDRAGDSNPGFPGEPGACETDAIVEEAAVAFELNIRLSLEVNDNR